MNHLNLPFEIPGYRISRRLGLGGMATVYLATQESLDRLVAVKVLASERAPSDELVQRFENEARTIARLDHPHIVSIHDVGRTSNGQIYYTMPYLPNGDLSRRNLRDEPERVLEVVRALAEALACAHDQGIVHRDVKPENVLFDKLDRPLLADFGIALNSSGETRVTREGATIGSSGYMSPEQARGQPLDGRSDLYSLGVVCYELLTGELPYRGGDALAVALAHIEKPVPRLPMTRRAWQPLIDRALAKQPDARFQSAEEMLAALDVVGRRLHGPATSRPARAWHALVERTVAIPRAQRALMLGGLLLLALAGLLALLPHVPERAAQPESSAPDEAPAADGGGAIADPAATAEPAPADEPRAERLQRAAALLARGRLVAPAGDNAAEQYLAVLADEPDQPDAVKGIRRILDALAQRAAKAIGADDGDSAIATIGEGVALSDYARLGKSAAFGAFVATIRRAIEERRARPHDPFDTRALAPLRPLLPTLLRIDPALARAVEADLERPATLLRSGGAFRDRNGPAMIALPAGAGSGPAFAIATTLVTRGAWARFAAETGRAPARCRASQRLLARSDGLSWRSPGFEQDDEHPVVCVSWDDANAYAGWLSQRTGARYRLPKAPEWLRVARPAGSGSACGAANLGKRAGDDGRCDDGYLHTAPVGRFAPTPPGVYDIAGNVSEWLGDCARERGDGCRERLFRGTSWRDGDDESNLQRSDSAAADLGYANVGFRLVRELPAPRDPR